MSIPFNTFDAESSIDDSELLRCSTDASIFKIKPVGVLFPEDSSHIMSAVRRVTKLVNQGTATSLTPRAAGTCMSGGSLTHGIVVDTTKYMNRIGKSGSPSPLVETVQDGVRTLTVQPGVYWRNVETFLAPQGLHMPVYPASHHLCAVGGMFGNNCGGELSLLYGKAAQWVHATKHVFSDGNEYTVSKLSPQALVHKMAQDSFEGRLYKGVHDLIQENWSVIERNKPKVSKNSAGYYLWNVLNPETGDFDMNQLLCGSQGTLGIATEITWRLNKVESAAKMIVVMLPDLSRLGDIVNTLLEYRPSSIESYDDASLKLAVKFFPDFIKQLGVKKAFSLGMRFLPELGMMLRGGVPKLILVAEFTGNSDEEIDRRLMPAYEAVQKYGYVTRIPSSDEDEQKYWTIRRESFNLLRKHMSGKRTAPFIDDVCVDPVYLPEFLPKLHEILQSYSLNYTIAGHAGNGNFHIIPLMDFHDSHIPELLVEVSDKVYALVREYEGSITAEHNDGIVRTPYLHYMFDDEMLALFKKVKEIFDPLGIFNPGKKVGGTVERLKGAVNIESA
jgi:FAD/FMN-containing dehydrogenase